MIKAAYIISYFGSDPARAAKRRKLHIQQVEWMLKEGLQVIVLANQYTSSDYIEGVRYIEGGKTVLAPGEARNILLKDFYQSKDEWALFADNDAILYQDRQHGIGANFKAALNKCLSVPAANDIHLFMPVNPASSPIKEKIKDAGDSIVFERATNMKGSMFFLRNQRNYDEQLFMSDDYGMASNGGILGGEDGHFCLQMIANGYGTYTCADLVLKELDAKATNSTWSPSMEHRKEQSQQMHRAWYEAFKRCGMNMKANGTVDRKEFLETNWVRPKKISISG